MCLRLTFNVWHLKYSRVALIHWGRVTHICVVKLTIIGSDNGLSPGWRRAIIWTNAGILLIWPLGTNFSEIFIGIQTFSFNKMHLKMSSAKRRPFCLGLNVLKCYCLQHCNNKKSTQLLKNTTDFTLIGELIWDYFTLNHMTAKTTECSGDSFT